MAEPLLEHVTIINDLATVIICAGVAGIAFHYFRLPLMLGYLLSGFLVGMNAIPWPMVHDQTIITDLSELGVIFLMFYIGLEFDLGKLQKMLVPAVLGVSLQSIAMIFVGMLMAPLLGWSNINGLFLGGLLAISSTMISFPILKAQDGMKQSYGQITIGILILEDILAIMMLVILTGVGVTGHFAWNALWQVTFLVGIFVVMVFSLGRLLAPYLIRTLQRINSIEVLTLVIVGVVLGIGELADKFHFSKALGAFIAGSIFSQTALTEQIEHAIEPLRNLFTAIFFVTVGMLIKPILLITYWKPILILTVLVVVLKTLTCWTGLFISGVRPATGFQSSLCKAQIGEFSFIIASLGESLGVTHPGLMGVAVGVSLGTVITIPFLSNRAEPIFGFLAKQVPSSLKEFAEFYQTSLTTAKDQLNRNALLALIKRPVFQAVVYFLFFHGIVILASLTSDYVSTLTEAFPYQEYVTSAIWVLAALLGLPFLIAVIRNVDACFMLVCESIFNQRQSKRLVRGPISNVVYSLLLYLFLILFSGSYLSAAASHLPSGLALIVFVGIIFAGGVFFWRYVIRVNSRLEYLFKDSFSQNIPALNEEARRKNDLAQILKKYPWPVDLCQHTVKNDTYACGRKIYDIKVREKTGASVIAISRGTYTFFDPGPDTPLFPGDEVTLLGNRKQNREAEALLGEKGKGKVSGARTKFKIHQVFLGAKSPIVGETLASIHIRKKYGLNVIGIQRGETRITAPKSEEILKANDLLLMVGNDQAVEHFEKNLSGQE